MSELTAADDVHGVAAFDGRTLARPDPPMLTVPEAGGPASVGQVGPYVMTGQTWVQNPLATAAPTSNGFDVTLSGASAVRLDLARMGIDPTKPITAKVTTDTPLSLRLDRDGAGLQTLTLQPGTTTLLLP
jgi:hypothetical protein